MYVVESTMPVHLEQKVHYPTMIIYYSILN